MQLSFEHLLTLNRLATVARQVSGATHEVNNALQVIGGTVELLGAAPDLPDHARKGIERIGAQAGRAAAAMAGMAELVRSQPATSVQVDLVDVMNRASGFRRYAVGRAGLTLAVDSGLEALHVIGHPSQLLQALLNLIDNAEQALRSAGVGHITLGATAAEGWVRIVVSDDGPGVAADIAPRMFEPFVTSRPRHDSLGLGLPVARSIAEAHGGSLDWQPSPRGATFVLRLPQAVAGDPQRRGPQP